MPGLPSGADTRRSRSAQLQLNFLGPFEVTLDGQPVSGFAADKVRALLAYLAVEGTRRDERSGQPHRREALAGLLWPDYPDSDALISLRQAIHRLRQALGEGANVNLPPLLLVTSQTLQLDTDTYRLDVDEFSELVEACRTLCSRRRA